MTYTIDNLMILYDIYALQGVLSVASSVVVCAN